MDDQNRNLILAMVLSALVMLVWFVVFPPPEPPAPAPEAPAQAVTAEGAPATAPGTPGAAPTEASPEAATTQTPRVPIDTPLVTGSISLVGGRIDDLSLDRYRETLRPGSDTVTLLAPAGSPNSFYALFGWGAAADGSAGSLPGPETAWSLASGSTLGVGAPVTLAWQNDAGLTFTRTIEIDDQYLFTVTDRVENTSDAARSLYAFGVVERQGLPSDMKNFFILHEGAVVMADGALTETKYTKISDLDPVASEGGPADVNEVTGSGWIGFTDHFWQAVLVPETGPFTAAVKHVAEGDIYRTVARQPVVTLEPGAAAEARTRLFAGPKEWQTIRHYENNPGFLARLFGEQVDPSRPQIDRFIDSIDWGWFFFLTKPIFAVLHWLNQQIGNMGLAIIGLTILIKTLLFPLARKSYISMARMKELQPEMEKIKERAGDDRQRLQKEMMDLYKSQKVNPAAGCLPILLQIPIFFSLYKVIFVTIELRHAPFFGWIRDLSAPDPSSIFNLYGLLPWAAPEPGTLLALIFIGVLPLLLGISMWFQMKLNPAPTDPTQAAVFAWMPWIFMFMLGSFASGLIIYWIANNTITFLQQYIIMWSHGKRPDLFGNIRSGFQRKAEPAASAEGKKPGGK